MNEIIQTILNRRSIRKYKDTKVPQELLDLVIEAGIAAPSGGNSHTAHIYVIQDSKILDELKVRAMNEFKEMTYDENTYRSLKNTIIKSQGGNYDFTYNAPCLIVLADQRSYGNNMADCVGILENMMIAASSLGLGTCYINQLHWLEDKASIIDYLHIPSNETICCSMVIGYPDMASMPRVHPKNPITYLTNENI